MRTKQQEKVKFLRLRLKIMRKGQNFKKKVEILG